MEVANKQLIKLPALQ